MKISSAGFAFALLLLSAETAAAQNATQLRPKIDSVTARLFYETTGVLSRDILGAPPFNGHNTIIGEGDAEQPANDILVAVALSVTADQANVDLPLTIRVTGDKGKVLAQRVFKSHFFKSRGRLVKAIWVGDAACAGDFRVEATIGAAKMSKRVTLRCGE